MSPNFIYVDKHKMISYSNLNREKLIRKIHSVLGLDISYGKGSHAKFYMDGYPMIIPLHLTQAISRNIILFISEHTGEDAKTLLNKLS